MKHVTLAITGMSCGHCVATVQTALKALNGVTVQAVRVGEAELFYDPATVSPNTVIDAIAQRGYTAVVRAEADDPVAPVPS